MIQVAPGWILDVERGPDWLLVRLDSPPAGLNGPPDGLIGPPDGGAAQGEAADDGPLGEVLWSLLEQHFTYRLVLECDKLALLDSTLVGQFLMLQRRIREHGGLLRLCGLSPENRDVLRRCRLEGHFPHYASRAEAILGRRPTQPR